MNNTKLYGLLLLSLPALSHAHGNKVNTPDTGIGLELEIEHHLMAGVPDNRYLLLTPVMEQAETTDNGINSADVKFSATSAIDNNWLAHATISNHSHGGDSELEVDQGFIQGRFNFLGTERPITVKLGRFYSSSAFYNQSGFNKLVVPSAPLIYQAFMGGELRDDGVQLQFTISDDTRIALEVFSGDNTLAGQRDNDQFSLTQVAYLDHAINLEKAGHLDLKVALLNSDQNYQSGDGHSHSNSDLSYQLKGDLQQLMLSAAWNWQQWTIQTEVFKRWQDARITTSDQLLQLDDNSYGGYGLIRYQLNKEWALSGRYDQITADGTSSGHQSLISALALPIDKTPANLLFSASWTPASNQIWTLNAGYYEDQWQNKDQGWYGGLSYQLRFSAETL